MIRLPEVTSCLWLIYIFISELGSLFAWYLSNTIAVKAL